VLPTLLIAGSGSLLASGLGQPARLSGIRVGALPPGLWGWALGLTLIACLLGSLMVRLLPALAALVQQLMGQRRWSAVLVLSGALGTLALLSGGLSLNDGSLSLVALLQGNSGGGLSALIWRWPATLLSLASGAPGGLMHDAMTLGALLVHPLAQFSSFKTTELAQLAAVGATAFFAAGTGTPMFCAVFVVTLQGDAALLPALLLVSALSTALGAPLRGQGWNESQAEALFETANRRHT
jgi:H+/Cl- antiporter ClcA